MQHVLEVSEPQMAYALEIPRQAVARIAAEGLRQPRHRLLVATGFEFEHRQRSQRRNMLGIYRERLFIVLARLDTIRCQISFSTLEIALLDRQRVDRSLACH